MKFLSPLLLLALLLSHPAPAPAAGQAAPAAPAIQDATSENTPMLRRALALFPNADFDHDGVLTSAEAIKYRQQHPELRAGKKAAAGAKDAAKIGAKAGRKANKQAGAAAAGPNAFPAPTFENVAYGPDERNVLDFWKAAASTPAPVLVCIHGGGFVGGDKSSFRRNPLVAACLQHGISVAAIHYRFITTAPFPAPMLDGARAVQFIRSKAREWNVDPARIGAMGGSAGANISIWLACHDDLALKDASDPVARQSTRLSFVIGLNAQTFNDPAMIQKYVYAGRTAHTSFAAFYGVSGVAEIGSERVKKLAHDASAIYFVTKDDPPVYLDYAGKSLQGAPLPDGTPQGVYIHHPKFGELFKQRYDALGLECEFHYKEHPARPNAALDFILKHFGK